jgi:integrase
MATFKQYIKKDGSEAWMFQAYLGTDYVTGKEIRTTRRGFKTKKKAQVELNKLLVDFNNQPTLKKNTNITFGELYELWLAMYMQTVNTRTFQNVTHQFNNHILPTFEKVKINKLSIPNAQKMINNWASGKTARMIANISRVVKYGVSVGICEINPFDSITKPKNLLKNINNTKIKYYSKEQLSIFLGKLNDERKKKSKSFGMNRYYRNCQYYLFWLLAYTGVRIGEAYSLLWSDVDLEKETISVTKTTTLKKDGSLIIGPPKTNSSNRTIPIDKKTLSLIKEWHSLQREFFLANGLAQQKRIFPKFDGGIQANSVAYIASKKIAEKCNLPSIGCHGFRHTHATLLFEAGVNPKTVQARLGHSDISMTLGFYTHVSFETQVAAVDRLTGYLSN